MRGLSSRSDRGKRCRCQVPYVVFQGDNVSHTVLEDGMQENSRPEGLAQCWVVHRLTSSWQKGRRWRALFFPLCTLMQGPNQGSYYLDEISLNWDYQKRMTFYLIGDKHSSMGELREFLIAQEVPLHLANKKYSGYFVVVWFEIITFHRCLSILFM